MDNDYFSIDAILAENQVWIHPRYPAVQVNRQLAQKIQCTFKVDVPDMGHLGGGANHDVYSTHTQIHRVLTIRDRSRPLAKCQFLCG